MIKWDILFERLLMETLHFQYNSSIEIQVEQHLVKYALCKRPEAGSKGHTFLDSKVLHVHIIEESLCRVILARY